MRNGGSQYCLFWTRMSSMVLPFIEALCSALVCNDKRIRNKTLSFLLLQVGRSPSLPQCFSPSPAGRPHWCSSSVTTHFVLILAPAQPAHKPSPRRPSSRVSYSTSLSISLQSTGTSLIQLQPTLSVVCALFSSVIIVQCDESWVMPRSVLSGLTSEVSGRSLQYLQQKDGGGL